MSADFLRHDFACGLDDAYVRLQKLANLNGWEKPARVLDDESMRQYAVDPDITKLAKLPYEQLPSEMRERFTDLMIERVLTFVGNEANMKSLKSGPIHAALRLAADHILFPER